MREALYRFIHVRYLEAFSVLPTVLLLIGLLIAVGIDSYIQKRQKQILLVICALVFSLIVQNYLDNLLKFGAPRIMLRRAVDIYGYSIRPVILLLFLHIVGPKRPGRAYWGLIAINTAIHLTALFSDICFTIDADNMYQGGWPVLKDSCLITSLILLGRLVWATFREHHPTRRKESWIPAFSVLILLLALPLDGSVADTPQPYGTACAPERWAGSTLPWARRKTAIPFSSRTTVWGLIPRRSIRPAAAPAWCSPAPPPRERSSRSPATSRSPSSKTAPSTTPMPASSLISGWRSPNPSTTGPRWWNICTT